MKQLTIRQIELIKSPKERGKSKASSSDNYASAYENTSSALLYIKSIANFLPYFEKYRSDFTKANAVCELFSQENFDVILKGVFPTKMEGAPLDDTISFDSLKITPEKISLGVYLFKFSSDYLLQAYPQEEYKHLHPRIKELVNDLKSMLDTIKKNKELERQIAAFQESMSQPEPPALLRQTKKYVAACYYCKNAATGENNTEAIDKIKHVPKCIAPKSSDKEKPPMWERWYVVLPPETLLITKEEREFLDKNYKKSK